MPGVAVVTDSTADLPPELARRHGITVVPLTVGFGDDRFLDGVDLDSATFLHRLARSPALPTTSQPSPADFERHYRALAADHDAIVSVHIAARLSGTAQSAAIAARAVGDLIPVTVVDSGTVSMGCGLLALTAATRAARGDDAAAIAARITEEARHMDIVFMVESLEALRRGGRIGRAAAMLGTLLDLKPILRLHDGEITPLERTRTRRRAVASMVAHVRRQGGIRRLCAVYTGRPDEAAALLREFDLLVPRADRYVTTLGPVVATHAGPGVIGFIFEREDAPVG